MDYGSEKWLLYFSESQPRRPAVIRQLLSNHLTTSALFWGRAYGLLDIIALPLDVNNFEPTLGELCQKKLLLETSKGICLTVKGRSRVEELKNKHQFLREPAFFNGFDLKGWEKQFYLLVQVASELSYQNNKYFAITNDLKAQQLFKNWFRRYGKTTLLGEITTSLTDFLAHEPELNAQLFCEQLTGHGRLGQTKAQLAKSYQLQIAEIEVGWRDLCARYAKYLLDQNFELAKLVMPYKRLTNLPASTEKTYSLFLAGKSIEEIADLRKIRKSTVQEHPLNVAILANDFPRERLLSPKIKKQIMDFFASCPVLDWKFQQLHESYPEISFFEYRLCQIERIIASERKA